MAGYFEHVGRVFTEKGAWYKNLLLIVLQIIMTGALIFGLMPMSVELSISSLNIPAIILGVLSFILLLGFHYQVMSNRMRGFLNVLPDVDFADMLLKFIKAIPFWLVWLFYLGLVGAVSALIVPSIAKSGSGLPFVLLGIVYFVFWIVFCISLSALLPIHLKRFSYKHVLNPFAPFAIFGKIAGPIFAYAGLYTVLSIVLNIVFKVLAALVGITSGEGFSISMVLSLIIIFVVYSYVYNVFFIAYELKICDIVREKLADTQYLDDDFEDPDLPAEVEDDSFNDGFLHDSGEQLDM